MLHPWSEYIDYQSQPARRPDPQTPPAPHSPPTEPIIAHDPITLSADTHPRGYKGRRIAVVRDIGPHVALYGLLGAAIGFGFWFVLAGLVNLLTWFASLINQIP